MLTESERAAMTARLRRGRGKPGSKIGRRPAGLSDLPLSYGQEQLWFIDRLAPGLPTYNLPFALLLHGLLDAGALARGVDGLVARHEVLRTRLVAGRDGRPVQEIDPPQSLPLELVDLAELDPDQRQAALREFIDVEALRPFTLADGPLLRIWLVRLATDEHMLLAVVHHTVFDGWSIGVFVRELAALYRQEATGEPSGLAELPVQFADYAVWERERLQGAALAELEAYWQGMLAGFDTVQFPTDHPRTVLENFEGAMAEHMASPDLLDGLRDVARGAGTTLFVLLMAGLQALLARYTGQTDLVVGTVSANRGKGELASLVGFLVNTLPIRAEASGDPPFTELLARAREATLGAYAHQDLPFARLVESLQVARDPSRVPVFQIALAYAERDTTSVSAAGVEFAVTDLAVGRNGAKFDLDILAESRSDGLRLECSYKTALFEAATVQRLLENFAVLLAGVVADPSAALSQLPVLTQDEMHAELVEWNDTAAQLPAVCIHQGFEAQVARTPDGIAVEFEAERLRYAELNQQANQIARRLRDLGVGPETLVGVCMRTGARRVAALLGIWKAGGGYVPLDPALPAERLSFMLADTGMTVVLADDSTLASLPETDATVLSLDAAWPAISELPDTNLADTAVSQENVAYVIYTSGSTGQPKGVVVEHRQAANFLQGMARHWRIGPGSAVLQFASFSFDVSVSDMFMPLLSGARLVLASAETLHSPPRLAALMREACITYADLPHAVLSLLRDEPFPGLRVLIAGGEELPSELASRWLRPGLRLVNAYGPTETTVTATSQELDASMSPPPIGLPLPNCQAYVLDAQLNPVPVGVIGELHIGGAGVARGYLNRPELTRQRFIDDPFSKDPKARLYRSGDLVRRRPDGAIMFVGRADGQVKIRGLRIELGEIEAALAAYPAVAQAVAAVVTDQAGEKQLAAYLRPEPGSEPVPAQLRAHLARLLPAYMVPAYLITVAEFPLGSSGKIDRSALPAPGSPSPPVTGHAAPATLTETVLVGLYAAVLGRERVAVTDSFFDIGGSSLQVMRLVDMISKKLGVDVGVSTIFLHPAPRQLAASIDAAAVGAGNLAGSGAVVGLSSGVGELPLFLIHAVGGTVFGYVQLAGELAGTFRVYGIEAPGLSQEGATADSLPGLVDDYVQRIRAAQPAGPYRLAGWSMGGVVAFEVARQLELAGQQVCLLALLDAPFALPDAGRPSQAQLAGRFLDDATHSLGLAAPDLPDPDTATAAEQLAWLARCLGAEDADRDALAAQLRRRFDVFQAHVLMLAGYQPAGTAVRAPTLIVSADESPNAPCRADWPRVLSGPVSTHRVAGDHYSFLRPPLVLEVGTSILKLHGDSG